MVEIYEVEYSKMCLELELLIKKGEQKILNLEDLKLSRERLSQSNERTRKYEIAKGLSNE